MLDDPSYPNSYIEYGDKLIEFRNAKIIDKKIICETIINLKINSRHFMEKELHYELIESTENYFQIL